MKRNPILLLTAVILQLSLVLPAFAEKEAPSTLKPAPKAEIIETCRIFEPPWGEQEWRQWWEKNPEDGEKWFAEVPKKMKTLDLSIIAQCTHLSNMFVGFAPLKDLKVFSEMTQLKRLDMRFALDVSDLSPLKSLKKLEYLNIWSTSVSNLSPLIGLEKLEVINARMTKVTDLSPLINMKSLKSIDLLKTPVINVSAMANAAGLEEILLCSTGVKDITALYPVAQRFTWLDLCNTPFRDFGALKQFSNIRTLKLWGMPLGTLEMISSLSKLEQLDLSGASFESLKPLHRLKKLKKIWLLNTKVDQKEIEELRHALPDLQVILELE